MTRINQFLSQRTSLSRRAAEKAILEKRVTVNDSIITSLATFVSKDDIVVLDGKRISKKPPKIYLLFNKPPKVLCTRKDPLKRKTIYDVCDYFEKKNLFPVGRLDFESRGVLLLTNDGNWTHHILHPKYQVPRTYRVKINTKCPKKKQTTIIEKSTIILEDGPITPKKVQFISPYEFYITLTEGKYHEVRRFCQYWGYKTVDLCRISYGPYKLGSLQEGMWKVISNRL